MFPCTDEASVLSGFLLAYREKHCSRQGHGSRTCAVFLIIGAGEKTNRAKLSANRPKLRDMDTAQACMLTAPAGLIAKPGMTALPLAPT